MTTGFRMSGSSISCCPVWLSSYTYRGKIYRFMVNGETGRVAGKAPVSPLKVLLACLARGGSGGSDRAARVFLRQFINRARLSGCFIYLR